jgi:hypothetical protein
MSRFLDQIFSCQKTRYTDFPPNDLLERCSVAAEAIDRAELERAEWLWQRRPRHVLFDGGKVLWGRLILYILTILFLVSFDIPGLLAASALSLVAAILVLFDYYWRERWRRDYDVALCRLIKRYLF